MILAGCGSGDGDGGSQPATAEGLAAAVLRYSEEFVENPASTYDSYSAACKEAVSRSDFAAELVVGEAMFEAFFGVPLTDLEVGEVLVRDVTETEGEAYVELLDPDGNPIGDPEYSLWVYEDGTWRSTDCEDGNAEDGEPESYDDAAAPPETVSGELRPADEVIEEQERSDAEIATVGGPAVSLGGVDLSIDAIRFAGQIDYDGTDNDYMVEVDVRAENRTTDTLSAPEVTVRCADGTEGDWYSGSTYEMDDDLPSGTFAEGVLVLGVPRGCTDPVARASDWDSDSSAIWEFPPGVAP